MHFLVVFQMVDLSINSSQTSSKYTMELVGPRNWILIDMTLGDEPVMSIIPTHTGQINA
jgi:hypothetical protein